MERLVESNIAFVEQYASDHPDDPQLPWMRAYVNLGQASASEVSRVMAITAQGASLLSEQTQDTRIIATESASSQRKIESSKYYPEIPLADELERQRGEATERIAVPLGIDRNEFLAQLPSRFPDRNTDYDRFALKVPLLTVDLTPFNISWLQMTEAANFYDPSDPDTILKAYIWSELKKRIEEDKLEVWKDPRKGIESFPQVPHGVWIQDGSRYVHRKSKDVRGALKGSERVGDHWKGTSLAILRPDMVKTMWWDLIGGQVGSDDVPYVGWNDGQPRFRYDWGGLAYPRFRALVCGSEFTVA